MKRTTLAALAVAATAVVAATLAPMQAANAGTTAVAHPATSNCFWFGPTFTLSDPSLNYAFPDSGAGYWAAQFTMPAGASIVLKGQYAHARYQSLNSYDATTHAPTDALNDVSTAPDAGSANPYLPGALRTSNSHRSYTATVLDQTQPAVRAGNTLYAGVAGQTSVTLVYRVYLPDKGRDITGGAGLPRPELHLADGQVLTGQSLCDATSAATTTPPVDPIPPAEYLQLRDQPGEPATFPAEQTPVWRAFYNTDFTLQCGFLGECDTNPQRTGGQYSNRDNNYVAAFTNRQFGPVLELTGKLPVTPQTLAGEPRMKSKVDMRYWSLCDNEFATTKGVSCIDDEDIPTTADGRYTIVASLPADRPRNATAQCGVAWLPLSATGDGAGHPDDSYLLMRNMLPSADFHHAVQDTTVPGDEQSVMGPYLPTGTYLTVKQFEKTGPGCRRS
jgi:hypothetical protein